MTANSSLLVLTSRGGSPANSRAGTPTTAQRRFQSEVEKRGGAWCEIETTVSAVTDQVRALAPGAFVLIHDETDLAVPGCLDAVTAAIDAAPWADVMYSDKFLPRRRMRGAGIRHRYPDWSPHRLASEQYIGNSFLVRAASLLSLAPSLKSDPNWRNGDFLLACAAVQARVEHVDAVWFERSLSRTPDVTSVGFERTSLALQQSDARNRDECAVITVTMEVDARSDAPTKSTPLLNYARQANMARTSASGEILIFVDEDFVPQHDDWIARLTQPFEDQMVGVTGATTLRHDGSLCHAGIGDVMDARVQSLAGTSPDDPRVAKLLLMNREVDAVSGACMAIRADIFDSIGGFSEAFPRFYADIDLCLKVRSVGYRVVNVGEVLGSHGKNRWRDGVLLPDEQALFISRWPTRTGNSDYPIETYG